MNHMTAQQDPIQLTASEAARKIREGLLTATDLVKACLARIEATDGQLKAWAHLDPEQALAQASELDTIRQAGRPLGSLHGVPVGLKDIIDSKGLPAERGSPIFVGRVPDEDAAVAERLRDAGAVILGKTKTTEVAFVHPTDTVNPHNVKHTPGGSSSGSAAAVAAYQIPLALGTQTNGSVIRPASFCGVYGFKPTRGVISREGVLQTSISLDQIGVFARSAEDTALITDVLKGYDQRDPKSYPRPRPAMIEGYHAEPPAEPALAWIDLPFADRMSADAVAGFEELRGELGARVEMVPAPPAFAGLVETQRILHEYEICQHLQETFEAHWDQISDTLKPVIDRGRKITHTAYEDALAQMQASEDFFHAFFMDYDVILTPAASGEAPVLGPTTGDPIFCTLWTLAGLPSLSMPLMVGETGLPIGAQIVGAQEEDGRLLRTARWLIDRLQANAA
ncbi:amidase [Roseibium polysiphoniae]|uniref:amidase n=1 Tax=Roseibium polysiphoniae TaxID=2571221 RepID=UPI003298F49B